MDECFIITPIGKNDSDIREKTDSLVKLAFAPALEKYKLKPIPAHKIEEPGSITNQVIKRLLDSKLVIADITGLNPNVMYEIGIRHCIRKPMITICEEGTGIPFDLAPERTIQYMYKPLGVEELKEKLIKVIPKALEDEEPDNPVYRVVDTDLIKISGDPQDASVVAEKRLSIIESQLEKIYSAINSIARNDMLPGDLLKNSYYSSFIITEDEGDTQVITESLKGENISCNLEDALDEDDNDILICSGFTNSRIEEMKVRSYLKHKFGIEVMFKPNPFM